MILNLTIFLRYTFLLIIGKIPWKNYFTLLKRLFLLKETFSSNKFVRIGNRVKMELWLAAFPQPSFWQVCDKFASTDDEPGCASVVIGITKACAYKCPHC